MNNKTKLLTRLHDKRYREGFVEAHIKIGIPFQIRILREQRGWTQKDLADRVGSKQAWIAQIENPNYSGFSLKTLLKIASVFDVGLIVRYVPFGDLIKWELNLSSEALKVASFSEDQYFKPQPVIVPGQSGLLLGGSASLEVQEIKKEVQKTVEIGRLYNFIDARQKKTTEDKMDADQQQTIMPLYEDLARASQ
jgi:transcriptional regulator with XRE-family HTH domain